MNKFDYNNFSLEKNYVIEASAGTGKTFNIVEIVKKLVNSGIDLQNILIVTYTEKAAGELKNRIRDKLKSCDIDSASIGTIHSFCNEVIKEYALTANLPLNLDLVDESEKELFIEKYIREGDIVKDIADNIEKIKIDILKTYLSKGVDKYYLKADNNEDESVVTIDCFVNANSIDKIYDKFPKIKENMDILLSGEGKVKELGEFLRDEGYKKFFGFNKTKFNKSRFVDGYLDAYNFFKDFEQKNSKPKTEEYIALKYLKDVYIKWQQEKALNKCESFNDIIRFVREAILDETNGLKNKLQEKYKYAIIDEFQDTNQLQFDIFEKLFLEDDEHHLIVVGDPKQSIYSFQGADINVYLKAKETIEKNNGLICSLVKNHRSTENMIVSCNKLFNFYNFDCVEKFENCTFRTKDVDKKISEVKYQNQDTKAFWIVEKKEEDTDTYKTTNEYEFALAAVQQIVDFCQKDENGKTKLQIKDKGDIEFRNVSFKDFAVLARTRSEFAPIKKALTNVGIPFILYKDKGLFNNGMECAHWVSVLEAINTTEFTNYNRAKFRKALFTKFFGLGIEDINDVKYDRDDVDEMRLINKWKVLATSRRWEDLIEDIIMSSGIESRASSIEDIQTLSKYKQIGDYCIDYLTKNHTLGELIKKLKGLMKGNGSDEDEENGSVVEKRTNFDCVQIMTIHASKGLQFPVVIVAGGFKQLNKSTQDAYTYRLDNGGIKLLTFNRNDTINKAAIEELKRLYYVAYTRGQYINIIPNYTVAKNALSFQYDALNGTEGYLNKNKGDYKIIIDNGKTYEELKKEVKSILVSSDEKDDEEEQQEKAGQVDKNSELVKSWGKMSTFKHSYSSLSHPKHEEETNVDGIDLVDKEREIEEGLSSYDTKSKQIETKIDSNVSPIEFPLDYPKGATIGTALHEIFELSDFTKYQDDLETLIKSSFARQRIKEKNEWTEITKDMVDNVLNASLPVVHGSNHINEEFVLKEIENKDKKPEMEFNFNLLNEQLKNYCNGFIDLLFRRGEYYSILDWKSDTLKEDFESYSDNESLKKHVDSCYSIQRVLYCYCLIEWLSISYKNLTKQEIFDKHFGGIYYVFLRGCNKGTGNGIYCQTWNSYKELEDAFNQIINSRIWRNK